MALSGVFLTPAFLHLIPLYKSALPWIQREAEHLDFDHIMHKLD